MMSTAQKKNAIFHPTARAISFWLAASILTCTENFRKLLSKQEQKK
jgi:actin-related protein